MKFSKFALSTGAMLVSAAFLSACGGGSSGGSTGGGGGGGGGGGTGGTSVSGGFGGTIADTAADSFDMLVTNDANGTYWVLYGPPDSNGVVQMTGFITGTSTQDTTALTFASTDGTDFGSATSSLTISGTYTDGATPTIAGTLDYSLTLAPTFSGTLLPSTVFDLSATPALGTLTGSWNMASLAGAGSRINVLSDGTFTGINDAGCQFSGSFTADPSGKNFFDSDITFGAGTCDAGLTGIEFKGIAIATTVGSAAQLMVTGIDVPTGTVGISATGATQSNSVTAAGAYTGSISDTQGHKFDMLVMPDNTFWVMYGALTNGFVNVVSFLKGTVTTDTGLQTFESTDAYDYGLNLQPEIIGEYSLSGSGSINGVIDYNQNNQPTFTGGPFSGHYSYTGTADPTALDGTWNMQSLAGQGSQIIVTSGPSGTTFTGTNAAGCNFTGQFTVDDSGANVFDSDITFLGGVCPAGTAEFQGIAILTHFANARQLVLTGIDTTDGTVGIAATGLSN